MFDVAVVGGGIVGLAVARAVSQRYPGASVVVLEKEATLAAHQTGRNSGVIHSGVYYRPGTLKAKLATEGSRSMLAFCQEHGIAHRVSGKLIVATDGHELAGLDELHARGVANGVPVELLPPEGVAEREPHVRSIGALDVPTAAVVDYRQVVEVLARSGDVRTGTPVTAIQRVGGAWHLATPSTTVRARFLVTCGGLQSDRLARQAGTDPGARVVPFRGEYFDVRRTELVRGLVYPVPDLRFPFLGVHLTRGVHGDVHAGPNAVLALAREGYAWRDVSGRDLLETIGFPGFWRMARTHWRYGLSEVVRSLAKERFVRAAQRLVPDLRSDDLVRAPAGVRAQAVDADGTLVDDFRLVDGDASLHVVNAPSPAATASLEIGRSIAERISL